MHAGLLYSDIPTVKARNVAIPNQSAKKYTAYHEAMADVWKQSQQVSE